MDLFDFHFLSINLNTVINSVLPLSMTKKVFSVKWTIFILFLKYDPEWKVVPNFSSL